MKIPTPFHLLQNTITLRTPIDTLDSSNGPVETFVDAGSYKAKVQFNVGNDAVQFNAARHTRSGYALTAPGVPVNKNMRLVYDGIEYSINSVRDTSEIGCVTRIDFESIELPPGL
jgi:SPP1 family predicted phage head-tail adaptor